MPGKNIRDLCGKPLVAYSIEAAIKTPCIDRVIVSTDDEEIANISKSYGAEVPFLRPREMARDNSSVSEAVDHLLKTIREDGYFPDVYAVLYPTHPFRPAGLIEMLIQKSLEGHSPVDTVKAVGYNSLWLFSVTGGNVLPSVMKPRGDKLFYRTYGVFHSQNTTLETTSPYFHVLDDPVSLIDIDTLADFCLAEEIIRAGLFSA